MRKFNWTTPKKKKKLQEAA